MKILHTADWHLGKRLESFSRLNEQVEVLDEICAIAEREQVEPDEEEHRERDEEWRELSHVHLHPGNAGITRCP